MKYSAEEKHAKELKAAELNKSVGFPCLHYSVSEGAGVLKVEIVKKLSGSYKVGVRTVDDTANAGEDYEEIDKILEFKSSEDTKVIEIGIVDDNEWEPDEDFLIELYDPTTQDRLDGKDTQTRVTIIDDDQPGIISWSQRHVRMHYKDEKVVCKLVRQHGCDGTVSVKVTSEESKDSVHEKAVKFEQFKPIVSEDVVFLHGETEKEVTVNLIVDDMNDETDVHLNLRVAEPTPEGLKISKKDVCFINIVGDLDSESTVKDIEKILEIMQK